MSEERFEPESLHVAVKGRDLEFIVTLEDGERVKFSLGVDSARSILEEVSRKIDEHLMVQGGNHR